MKKKSLVFGLAMIISLITACGGSGRNKAAEEGKNRLEQIVERGYIEVVTEPYFAPYEFIDPNKSENEKVVGSDVELAKYIAKELGVELRIIPLEFSAVQSSVTEGKYDLAISALAYTPAREQAMNLSKGYYFAENDEGYGILIRNADVHNITSIEALADKVVVAQSGSLQELFINEQVPKYKEFKKVSATTDGFLMVQEMKADAAACSVPMAQLYIEANPDANLAIMKDFRFTVDESTSGTRIGMPPGEDELTEEINRIIDEVLESGEFLKWHEEYTEYAKKLGL